MHKEEITMYNYSNISVEALQKLGIYELRNLARQIGVYSPTRFKKEDLIEKIMAIVQGVDAPYKRKTNQGRPAKQMAGFDDILNIFVPPIDEKTLYAKPFKNESLLSGSFMQEMNISENTESFSGFVRIIKDYAVALKNGFFEGNDKTFYITTQVLKSNNLKNGDFVKGRYYLIDDDKSKVVKQIDFINGQVAGSTSNVNREDYESLGAVYPKTQICLGKMPKASVDFKLIDKICPFGEGSRVLINYDNDCDIEDFVAKLINNLTLSCQYKTTMISTDERPEDISYLCNECVEMQMITRDDQREERVFAEQMLNTFDYAVRQVEYGNNNILIIKNLQKFYNFFVKHFVLSEKCTETEAKFRAMETIKKYLLLAKNTANGHALTIIAFNSNFEELNELFNCYIKLNALPVSGTDIYIDCFKSYTLKANTLLSKEDYRKLLEFRNGLTPENLKSKIAEL